jgi:muramoyltetrapeptide carboxypeptidase
MKIGIVAPSSRVPQIELGVSVEKLKASGFAVEVHPQCNRSHLYFSGNDLERAVAFYDFARRPEIDAIWCARGGYGATRLLPLIDQMVMKLGIPSKKLLVGSSDATSIMDYVKTRWGWSVLHAPMPGLRNFSCLEKSESDALISWVRGERSAKPWGKYKLKFYNKAAQPIVGNISGGNLTIITSLIGTSYAMRFQDKILFLEDIDEPLYRIDRMIQQSLQAGVFQGVKAIVLGNFLNCMDYPPMGLKAKPKAINLKRLMKSPKPKELMAVRKVVPTEKAFKEIFESLGKQLDIPVAYGLPVGHGPEHFSLPLGARCELSAESGLKLLDWDWLKSRN